MTKILAIIPARGGSKGVPRKNIRPVGGKPLIYYSIKAALGAKSLTDVVVSTEDAEIAEIAKGFGAWVPFLRPQELAQDSTPSFPVVDYTMKRLNEMGKSYDCGVWLQPTSPLRKSEDIDNALKLLMESEADSVVSVEQVEDYHPCRMYRMSGAYLDLLQKDDGSGLRQRLDKVYHRNGAVYAFKTQTLSKFGNYFGEKILPYEMPRSQSVNIDDEYDLLLADFLIRHYKINENNP